MSQGLQSNWFETFIIFELLLLGDVCQSLYYDYHFLVKFCNPCIVWVVTFATCCA